jgi:hypothetical protein
VISPDTLVDAPGCSGERRRLGAAPPSLKEYFRSPSHARATANLPFEKQKPLPEVAFAESKPLSYEAYLNSKTWKFLRSRVLRRDDDLCQVCREAQAKHVHHLTYVRFGRELLADLLSVCVPCHEMLHTKVKVA